MNKSERLYKQIQETYRPTVRRLKQHFMPKSFTGFYFQERPLIAKWNKDKSLIHFGFLGLRMKLDRDYRTRLFESFVSDVYPLNSYAEKILEEGWKWSLISIREYNMVVLFADFCRKMVVYGTNEVVSDDIYFKMEEAFLRISSRPEYVVLLLETFRKVLSGNVDEAGESRIDVLMTNLAGAFDADEAPRSLRSYLLAYNMVRYRTYFKWNRLARPGGPEFLQDRFYDCPPKKFAEIVAYFKGLKSDRDSLRSKMEWLEWLKSNSAIDDEFEPSLIVKFYNDTRFSARKHDWQHDSMDLFLVVRTLFDGALHALSRIVQAEWRVLTSEEKLMSVHVVTDDAALGAILEVLQEEVPVLDNAYAGLANTSINVGKFVSSDDVHDILPTEGHRTFFARALRCANHLYRAAVRLHELRETNDYTDSFYLKNMLVAPDELRGQPLMAVFTHHARVFLQISRFLRSRELLTELRRVSGVEQRLRSVERELNRIDAESVLMGMIDGEAGEAAGKDASHGKEKVDGS